MLGKTFVIYISYIVMVSERYEQRLVPQQYIHLDVVVEVRPFGCC